MADGDQILLRWDTGILRTSRVDARTVDATEVGKATLFAIPRPRTGSVGVSYLIGRSNGEWISSEWLHIALRE
ncbi:hypothetical protein [Streptomyces violascens]|uniref:hypothetical protein n=1 Tax=Streptomyces violascens TaxID=67381 RepID=UPI0036910FDA